MSQDGKSYNIGIKGDGKKAAAPYAGRSQVEMK